MWKIVAIAACTAAISLNSTVLAADTGRIPPAPTQVAAMLQHTQGAVFPVGTYNARNTAHFTGDSYVASLSDGNIPVANVTFVHGAHTYWHIHHGTSQILLAVSGKGYYQLDGQAPHVLLPGQSVTFLQVYAIGTGRHLDTCFSILLSWNLYRGLGQNGVNPLTSSYLIH